MKLIVDRALERIKELYSIESTKGFRELYKEYHSPVNQKTMSEVTGKVYRCLDGR